MKPSLAKENIIEPITLKIIKDEHASLAAMLRSMRMMIDRGPKDEPEQFFDVLRAMLFYIDEFPERLHHPKESKLLFPLVAKADPQTQIVITRLERDHDNGEKSVRALMHLLHAWELMGDSRRCVFQDACLQYIAFYLEHMRVEEEAILPVARATLSAQDWQILDAAFSSHVDPLVNRNTNDGTYNRLFSRILLHAPAPIGLGHA